MSLPAGSAQRKIVNEVSALLHADKIFDAAKAVAAWANIKVEIETKEKAHEVLNVLLHWLLNNDGKEEAAQLLWSPTLFSPNPEATKRVWKAFDRENFILLMGAASMSKSYSMGVNLLLEWIRDPEFTNVQVLGPSENHLEDNLFSHLVSLHRGASIPLPGQIAKLFIGIDSKSRKGAIRGVVVPLGKKAAGRIQGTKRIPRKTPHPVFGKLSRLFIFIDELVNVPMGIWKDIDNVIANVQGSGDQGLKLIGAFNPTTLHDETGKRCEPPCGWNSFNADEMFDWVSTRGWRVVRLDAKFSENVVQGKIVFAGLQTLQGFNKIIENSGGTDSPGYWSMARGCFPPTGVAMSVIPSGLLNKLKAEFIWQDIPKNCAGLDLAFTKDTAVFAKGKFGAASGVKLPPSLEHPLGITIFFKDDKGRSVARYALQLESLLKLPKCETPEMTELIKNLCRQLEIEGKWLCLDKTGNGQGVWDLLRHTWSSEVLGVNFGGGCTNQKILQEESETPEQLYKRLNSELFFAMRKWIEFDALKILPGVDTTDLYPQLSNRLFRANGKFSIVESKLDYETRNNARSPDDADALSLLIHVARMTGSAMIGMSAANSVADGFDDDSGDYHRVDATNRTEDL